MHHLFQFAYLDAGTGSLIIQSIIGLFAGIAVFGHRMKNNIKLKFAQLFGKKSQKQSSK
jgi:hypothetical protein